jgi:hypothetical protein
MKGELANAALLGEAVLGERPVDDLDDPLRRQLFRATRAVGK